MYLHTRFNNIYVKLYIFSLYEVLICTRPYKIVSFLCYESCVLLKFKVYVRPHWITPGPKKNSEFDSFPFYSVSALTTIRQFSLYLIYFSSKYLAKITVIYSNGVGGIHSIVEMTYD